MFVTFLTFIVNFVVVTWILLWTQTVYPFKFPELLQFMQWADISYNIGNTSMIVATVILMVPFMLSHTRLMQYVLVKTLGCRTPSADERQYLEQIVKFLCQRSGESPNKYHLYVKRDDTLNAFAVGRDNICVHTGLLNVMNAPQVAAIVAHEMGHIQNNDTIYGVGCGAIAWAGNGVVQLYVTFIRILSIFASLPIIGWLIAIIILFVNLQLWVMQFFLNLPLQLINMFSSRQNEYAADRYACEIGLGRELYEGLSILMKFSGESKMGFFSNLMSTHPATPKRLARIQEYLNGTV